MSSNQSQDQPGLISGHAQYIKGATVNAVGNVTGSEEWSSSGASQKAEAVETMKKASENRDPQKDGFGRVEEVAGKVAGCEGMQEEGRESKKE